MAFLYPLPYFLSPIPICSTGKKVIAKVNTSMGEVFATAGGLTLYTFTKDGDAASNCYGGCASNWPPFLAKADGKTWGAFIIIQRNDGNYQWAYENQP